MEASMSASEDQIEFSSEYQEAIKAMKEQIHFLKNKLAVTEDLYEKSKQTENFKNDSRNDSRWSDKAMKKYEAELDELGQALRSYEIDNEKLLNEKNHWERVSQEWERQYSEYLQQLEELKTENDELRESVSASESGSLLERFRDSEVQRIRAQEDAEFYKEKYMISKFELDDVTEQLMETKHVPMERQNSRGDFGEMDIRLAKTEEQLKSSNQRYHACSKKVESLENANKTLKEKNQTLAAEKAKMTEKWQNAIQRLKNEEKSKKRIAELEEQVLAGTTENGKLTGKLEDLNNRYIELEKSREADRNACKKLEERLKKMQLQRGLEKDERDVIEKMNQDLSIKAHKLESELRHVQDHMQFPVEASPQADESPMIELNIQLETELSHLKAELMMINDKLAKKESECLSLEMDLSRMRQSSRQGMLNRTEQSLPKMMKNLAQEADFPLHSLESEAKAREELQTMQEKYEQLLRKYQSLEERNLLLDKQLKMSSVAGRSEELQCALETDLCEKESEIFALHEKVSTLENKLRNTEDALARHIVYADQRETLRSVTPPLNELNNTAKRQMRRSTPCSSGRKTRSNSQVPSQHIQSVESTPKPAQAAKKATAIPGLQFTKAAMGPNARSFTERHFLNRARRFNY